MNACAAQVLKEIPDVFLAYGQSDEYSFLFRRSSTLWGRRSEKWSSNICSLFTASFVLQWKSFFPDLELTSTPSFDARCVEYPSTENIRDYFSWRQADCHINNLYNTSFWALVQNSDPKKTEREAQDILKDTDSAAKNELLFSQFGINYAKEPEMYRKGSTVYKEVKSVDEVSASGKNVTRQRTVVSTTHEDLIGDTFWDRTRLLDIHGEPPFANSRKKK